MDYSSMKSFTPNGPNSMGSTLQSSPFPKTMLSRRRSSVSGLSLRKSAVNTHILIRDETLLKLLSRTPDQPLRPNMENFVNGEKGLSPVRDENMPPPGAEQQKLPNSCHRVEGKPLEKGATPEYSEMSSSPKTLIARGDCKTWETYPSMCLVQQELEAGPRPDCSRDKSALKDSAKNYFNNNDEKIRIAEEKRTTTARPKSIQEVMKDVVVYVEVRTGEDNRSAGVKKVISQLGAKVNDKLLRNTTHVVFKDGLLSTYNKAKKWDIPLVSILWIEECKKQMKLMDPILFPISNIDRYENPELYGRLKRIKSMQPDSEEKCRRNRPKTVKETEIEKTAKTNSALVVPKKPKDKLDEILYEFHEKLLNTPDDNGDCLPFESKLLQRIKNSPFTPKSQKEQNKTGIKDTLKGEEISAVSEQSEDCNNSVVPHARKTLKFGNSQKELPDVRLAAGALKSTKSESDCVGSTSVGRRTTRRSSLSATAATSTESSSKKDQNKSVKRTTLFTIGEQPSNQITSSQVQKPTSNKNSSLTPRSAKKSARRRTLFTPTSKVEFKWASGDSTRAIDSYFPKKSSKRKTIFDPIQTIEESIDSIEEETPTQLNVEDNTVELVDEEKGESNRRKTSLNLLEEHASTFLFSSTRTPQMAKRRTLFDISMDIIDQRLQSINKSAKQNKMRRDSIESEHSITPVNQLRRRNSITDSNSQSELLEQTPTEDMNKNEKSLSTEVSEQQPKKRKLFAPLDMASSPAVLKDFDPMKSTAKKRKKIEEASSANKKRRTLFVPGLLAEDSPIQETKPDRRRTMGFDVIRKIAVSHSGAKAELAVPFLV